MRLVLAVVAALALAACGGKAGTGDDDTDAACDGECIDGFEDPCTEVIGDLSQPMEVVPVTRLRHDTEPSEVAAGADVDLIPPFQGGYIVLLGGKVRNVNGCTTDVIASMRDPSTGQVLGLEQRPSRLAIGADGWGHPSGSVDYVLANVAVCPNFAGSRDVQDQPWEIEIRYESADHRTGTATRTVIPRCQLGDFDCPCMCSADFSGGCSPFDGRLPDLADAGPD